MNIEKMTPQKQTPTKQNKLRLKKDTINVYRDQSASPTPKKKSQVKAEKPNALSPEEEEELNQLVNLNDFIVRKQPDVEDIPSKPTKKVKQNRVKSIDLNLSQRSPSKVATYLRIPLTERNYSFRNRDELKNKIIV